MLDNMVYKEGGGIIKSPHRMTNNLRVYFRFNNLSMVAATNLHINSGWSKTNENIDGVLEALTRDHQGGKTEMGWKDTPPISAATVTASSLYDGSYTDSWRREKRIRMKKENNRREERERRV